MRTPPVTVEEYFDVINELISLKYDVTNHRMSDRYVYIVFKDIKQAQNIYCWWFRDMVRMPLFSIEEIANEMGYSYFLRHGLRLLLNVFICLVSLMTQTRNYLK